MLCGAQADVWVGLGKMHAELTWPRSLSVPFGWPSQDNLGYSELQWWYQRYSDRGACGWQSWDNQGQSELQWLSGVPLWLTFPGQPGTGRDTLKGWAFLWPSLHNQGWSVFQWWSEILWLGYPFADRPRITRDSQSSSDRQGYCDMQGVSDGTSLAWQSLNVHECQHY